MRKVFLVPALMLGVASVAWGNPESISLEDMDIATWVVRTLPLNYSVDLLFLMIALWVTGQMPRAGWRMVPGFAILVCGAGYAADLLSDLHVERWQSGSAFFPPEINPYGTTVGIGEFAGSLAAASAMIFFFDLTIIAVILRLMEAESYTRLPCAAGIMAVGTAPYVGLPFLLVLLGLAVTLGTSAGLILLCLGPGWIRRKWRGVEKVPGEPREERWARFETNRHQERIRRPFETALRLLGIRPR